MDALAILSTGDRAVGAWRVGTGCEDHEPTNSSSGVGTVSNPPPPRPLVQRDRLVPARHASQRQPGHCIPYILAGRDLEAEVNAAIDP